MQKIIDLILKGRPLTGEQAMQLIRPAISESPEMVLDIMSLARLAISGFGQSKNPEPKANDKPQVFTCGIINAKSGRCAENCAFCAQSEHYPTNTATYPLIETEALMGKAETLAASEVSYMGIVISGTRPSPTDFDRICETAAEIISRTGLKLCASLGIITFDQALALKQAGFSSYHHNLETAPSFYSKVCTTHNLEARVATIKKVRKAGLRVCSGGIFGLGESWEQRLEMAELLGKLKVDSIPVNFLSPIPGTPLGTRPLLSPREALLIIASYRLMHPGRDIVICGGRGKVLNDWDRLIFSAGANGLMVGDYLTTKGSPLDRDLEIINELGLADKAANPAPINYEGKY